MHHNAIRTAALLTGISGAVVLFGWWCGGTTGLHLAVVIAIAVNGLAFFFSDTMALRAMRARPISEIEHPELHRIVRELATQARQPVPRLYIAPTSAPNAFATGRSPRRAALCCTVGLLRSLNERELRGVLAHELSHVCNRDILISSVAATMATLVIWLANLAWLLPLGADDDEEMPGLVSGLLFLVVGPLAACVIQLGVSRSREYHADAAGAQLTGDPLGLAMALRKIDIGNRTHPLPRERHLFAASHLMISSPFPGSWFGRIFAVHPPTAERILRLERLAGYRR